MTLKHCRDCGHEVSMDAQICPNCGCQFPAHEKSNFKGWLVFILALAAIAAALRHYVLHH